MRVARGRSEGCSNEIDSQSEARRTLLFVLLFWEELYVAGGIEVAFEGAFVREGYLEGGVRFQGYGW